MKNKYLFIIDPQNDFIEGGELSVRGGKEALQKIVTSGILNEEWSGIIVTLDSHNPGHLGFGEPKTALRKYLTKDYPRPTPWPPHCIIDTPGWEIYEPLQTKLLGMGEKITYLTKGETDWEDSYSIVSELFGMILIDEILSEVITNDIEFHWTGLAEDYCVWESIKGVIERTRERDKSHVHHILHPEMTACIKNHITENENLSITPYRP